MKEVVHTKTLEEYKYVISKIENQKDLNIFDYEIEGKNTCINLSSGRYSDIKYYKEQGYNIISFNEFKSRYEPQLKIGDTFKKDGFVCRVESEVENWVYDKYQEAYYKTKEWYSNYIVITDKEFIAQLEKYSQ